MEEIIGTLSIVDPIGIDEELTIVQTKYTKGNLCILLRDEERMPYATITVNLPTLSLAEGEFAVKMYSENAQFRAPLLKTGLFEDTGRRVPTGWTEAEIWRFAKK